VLGGWLFQILQIVVRSVGVDSLRHYYSWNRTEQSNQRVDLFIRDDLLVFMGLSVRVS